jgi:feruloyl esterase
VPIIFRNGRTDLANFTVEDVQTVRRSEFAQWYEARNPNLSAFFRHGGKLIMWHGESDPGPSPVGSNDYVKSVLSVASGARDHLRYFLLPGTGHCGGGPGASRVAWLDILESWDETGAAPQIVLGGGPQGMVRPHCAWPNVARYRGSGDANDPDSWQCVART